MFPFVALLIFTVAMAGAAYYVWNVPRQQAQETLTNRLRELRLASSARPQTGGELMRTEKRGQLASLGDFVAWIGLLRRLQEYIDQANLKYRAAEVFAVSVIAAAAVYLLLGLAGMSILILRVGLSLLIGAWPLVYIVQARKKRLR